MTPSHLHFRAAALVAVLSSTALLVSCAFAGSVTPVPERVKIAYLPVVHSLPLYLALEKGYFAEEGLEVETITFEAPNQLIDSLLSGQAHIGISAATGIIAVSQTKKPESLKIFGVSGAERGKVGTRNEAFLVGRDSTVASIADLRGKKLGVLPGIQWRTIARDILSRHGIQSEQDITLVELAVPLQAQALGSGQVDALLAIEPVPTVVVSKGIGRVLVDSPTLTEIGDPFYAGSYVANTTFLAEHPETARKILDVFAKATEEIMNDPDAARPYLQGYTPLDHGLIQQVPMLTWKMRDDLTASDIQGLQAFFDIFSEHGVIDGPVDASRLLIPAAGDGR